MECISCPPQAQQPFRCWNSPPNCDCHASRTFVRVALLFPGVQEHRSAHAVHEEQRRTPRSQLQVPIAFFAIAIGGSPTSPSNPSPNMQGYRPARESPHIPCCGLLRQNHDSICSTDFPLESRSTVIRFGISGYRATDHALAVLDNLCIARLPHSRRCVISVSRKTTRSFRVRFIVQRSCKSECDTAFSRFPARSCLSPSERYL